MRARADVAARLLDVRAVVLAVAALEALQDHLRRLDEALAAGVHVDAEAVELDPPEAAPEAEDDAAVRQMVEHADLFGDAHRVVPRQHDDHRAEQQRVALAGEVGEHLQHVGAHRVGGEVVLDAPDRLEAEPFGHPAEAQLLLVHLQIAEPRVRGLEDDRESDVHGTLLSAGRWAGEAARGYGSGRRTRNSVTLRPGSSNLPRPSRTGRESRRLFSRTRSGGTPTDGA